MKRKLVTLMLIISAVPLLLVSIVSLYLFNQNLQKDFWELSMSRANLLQTDVNLFITKHMDVLKHISKTPAVKNYDVNAIKPIIKEASNTYPNFVPISVETSQAKQIVKSDDSALVDVSDREFFQLAMKGQEEVFSDVLMSKANDHPIVVLATPIKSAEDGTVTGVLQGTIDLAVLSDFVSKRSTNGNLAYILDPKGKVIAHPDPKITSENKDMSQLEYVKKAQSGAQGVEEIVNEAGSKVLLNYSHDSKTGWIICLEQSYDGYITQRNRLIMTSLGILLGTLVIVFAVGYISANKTVRPITRLIEAAERIRQGNLTETLDSNQNDEIGKLADNFNAMAGGLGTLVKQVSGSADQVVAAAEQLTASAEQSAQAATQIAASITSVAQGAEDQFKAADETIAIVERLSSNIEQIAHESEDVADVSQQTSAATEKGGKAIDSAITQMKLIEQTVSETAKVVAALGGRSKEIGQIVDTIAGIAGQTNLLALNAAIEAARAGEQGRGFAVVAEEVRKLAEQSEEAAKKIAVLIEAVQNETDTVVAAMKNGTEEVKKGTKVVDTAGESFHEISSLICTVSNQVDDISHAVKSMAEDSQAIVGANHKIDHISKDTAAHSQTVSAAAEETSASMEEIAASSQALVKLSEELKTIIGQFKV